MPKHPEIEIVTPQFTREKGAATPSAPPANAEAWAGLRDLSKTVLKELGLRPWNNPNDPEDADAAFDGKTLMLLPGEWYSAVPAGYELVCIFGERAPFEAGVTDDDIRFGCLAYGILV